MKNTIKLLALAFVTTVMLTACANDNVTPAVKDSTPASSAAVSSQTEASSAPQQTDDENNAPYSVNNSTPASSAAVSSQTEASSVPQQTDDENNAPYTVGYDVRKMGDWGNIVVVMGYSNDKYEEGLYATHIEVGGTYEGKPVEGVYQEAFYNRKDIKNVVLPDSIYVIGGDAFMGCESLESITLPANLEQIGSNAFQSCKSLKEITFPDTLRIINGAAFHRCSNLENVVLPDTIERVAPSAFADCKKIQVTYKGQTYDYAHLEDLYKAVNGE